MLNLAKMEIVILIIWNALTYCKSIWTSQYQAPAFLKVDNAIHRIYRDSSTTALDSAIGLSSFCNTYPLISDSGVPNENIVQNHLNIALLNVF